ncbi:WD40 repeat-like protein [Schizopora paradoxa]|uniref:WD40 repeat-like protein n=1 Tax=Schizopora paradoxa TaxID=27342 RepID=A0A0H2RWF0_9AGAM|nr:WD40 repeat-like protein [Schizopora paradoxa]
MLFASGNNEILRVPSFARKFDLKMQTPTLLASGNPKSDDNYRENFVRCARWSPDGKQALAQCEDRTFQFHIIEPDSVFSQPDAILDFAWYPWSNIDSPGSSCFVASVKECPVKLLDATDGRLRASYKIVDHRERQVAPHSLAFNVFGTHLYCGYEDAIEVFDFLRPGEGTTIKTAPSKKSKDGMKGIVSSISFAPDQSGVYAASSLASSITLFAENSGDDAVAYLDGMASAITQVKFNPTQPHLLYATQRRNDEILCWDIRQPFDVLCRFRRKASRTNQKLLFDVDPSGQWLISGDEDGGICFFNMFSENSEATFRFHAHNDAVGSVHFHPSQSLLLSASGSRHFNQGTTGDPSGSETSESESTDEDMDKDASCHHITRRKHAKPPFTTDSSMKIWSLQSNLDYGAPESGAVLSHTEI